MTPIKQREGFLDVVRPRKAAANDEQSAVHLRSQSSGIVRSEHGRGVNQDIIILLFPKGQEFIKPGGKEEVARVANVFAATDEPDVLN